MAMLRTLSGARALRAAAVLILISFALTDAAVAQPSAMISLRSTGRSVSFMSPANTPKPLH